MNMISSNLSIDSIIQGICDGKILLSDIFDSDQIFNHTFEIQGKDRSTSNEYNLSFISNSVLSLIASEIGLCTDELSRRPPIPTPIKPIKKDDPIQTPVKQHPKKGKTRVRTVLISSYNPSSALLTNPVKNSLFSSPEAVNENDKNSLFERRILQDMKSSVDTKPITSTLPTSNTSSSIITTTTTINNSNIEPAELTMKKELDTLSQIYSLLILTLKVPSVTSEINFIIKHMNVPNHNVIIKEIKYFQSFSNIKYFMTLTWNYLENYRVYYEQISNITISQIISQSSKVLSIITPKCEITNSFPNSDDYNIFNSLVNDKSIYEIYITQLLPDEHFSSQTTTLKTKIRTWFAELFKDYNNNINSMNSGLLDKFKRNMKRIEEDVRGNRNPKFNDKLIGWFCLFFITQLIKYTLSNVESDLDIVESDKVEKLQERFKSQYNTNDLVYNNSEYFFYLFLNYTTNYRLLVNMKNVFVEQYKILSEKHEIKGIIHKMHILKTLSKFIGYLDFSPFDDNDSIQTTNYNSISLSLPRDLIESIKKSELLQSLGCLVSYLMVIQNQMLIRKNQEIKILLSFLNIIRKSILVLIETRRETNYYVINYLSIAYEIENLFHNLSYMPDDNSFVIPDTSCSNCKSNQIEIIHCLCCNSSLCINCFKKHSFSIENINGIYIPLKLHIFSMENIKHIPLDNLPLFNNKNVISKHCLLIQLSIQHLKNTQMKENIPSRKIRPLTDNGNNSMVENNNRNEGSINNRILKDFQTKQPIYYNIINSISDCLKIKLNLQVYSDFKVIDDVVKNSKISSFDKKDRIRFLTICYDNLRKYYEEIITDSSKKSLRMLLPNVIAEEVINQFISIIKWNVMNKLDIKNPRIEKYIENIWSNHFNYTIHRFNEVVIEKKHILADLKELCNQFLELNEYYSNDDIKQIQNEFYKVVKMFVEELSNKEEIMKIEKIEETLPRIFRKLVVTVTEHFIQYSFSHFDEYIFLLERMFENLRQYDLIISDIYHQLTQFHNIVMTMMKNDDYLLLFIRLNIDLVKYHFISSYALENIIITIYPCKIQYFCFYRLFCEEIKKESFSNLEFSRIRCNYRCILLSL